MAWVHLCKASTSSWHHSCWSSSFLSKSSHPLGVVPLRDGRGSSNGEGIAASASSQDGGCGRKPPIRSLIPAYTQDQQMGVQAWTGAGPGDRADKAERLPLGPHPGHLNSPHLEPYQLFQPNHLPTLNEHRLKDVRTAPLSLRVSVGGVQRDQQTYCQQQHQKRGAHCEHLATPNSQELTLYLGSDLQGISGSQSLSNLIYMSQLKVPKYHHLHLDARGGIHLVLLMI